MVVEAEQYKIESKGIDIEQVDRILSSFRGTKDELIPILKCFQDEFGYLPEESMQRVAAFLKMPESAVFGVASFYDQFKLVPTGRNVIKVCRGNACRVKGGKKILKEVEKILGIEPGESTPDLEYALETVACLGSCSLAPTMVATKETHGRITPDKVTDIIGRLIEKGKIHGRKERE